MTVRKPKLPHLAPPTRVAPKAQRDQLFVLGWESELLDQARTDFPAVFWWHGYRQIGDYFGSYCYICSAYIVTFSRRYPIPLIAKQAVDDHKMLHHAGKLPVVSHRSKKEAP